MKSTSLWLAFLCGWAFTWGGGLEPAVCLAQEDGQESGGAESDPKEQPAGDKAEGENGRSRLKFEIARLRTLQESMRESIRLRDEQIKPVTKLFDEHAEALTEKFKSLEAENAKNTDKVRELKEAMTAAQANRDREEVRRIRRELRDIAGLSNVMEMHRAFQAKVIEELDEEQAEKFRELARESYQTRRSARNANLDLVVLRRSLIEIEQTPEQAEAIRVLFMDHRQSLLDAGRTDPGVQEALTTKLRDAIIAKLTPEQVEKLKEQEEETRKSMEENTRERRSRRAGGEDGKDGKDGE